MTNLEKVNNILAEVFSVDVSAIGVNFDNKSIDGWDSIHQLSLATAVEDEFNIMLDAEDMLRFTSYDEIKCILVKYNIEM